MTYINTIIAKVAVQYLTLTSDQKIYSFNKNLKNNNKPLQIHIACTITFFLLNS
jgi:hypothetical protein